MRIGILRPWYGYCILAGLAAYGIYIAFQPRAVSIVLDSYFSLHVVSRLEKLLVPQFVCQHGRLAVLHAIQQEVPSADFCSIRSSSLQTAYVFIKSLKPLVTLNRDLVLTTMGTLLPASEFNPAIIAQLPEIVMQEDLSEKQSVTEDLHKFVLALPAEFYERYEIIWRNKTAIYLKERLYATPVIAAWHGTRFTPELMKAVELLQERMGVTRGALQKIIDVRMKGQIVVRKAQKGEI